MNACIRLLDVPLATNDRSMETGQSQFVLNGPTVFSSDPSKSSSARVEYFGCPQFGNDRQIPQIRLAELASRSVQLAQAYPYEFA